MNRRRWLWLLCAIPLVVGLARLRFDADIFNLLPGDLPAVRGLQLQQQNFSNARELLVTLHATDAEVASNGARAIATHLATRTSLVRSARWQPPWLEQPADAAENLAWLWLQQPPAEFAALATKLTATNLPTVLAAARETLTQSLAKEVARIGITVNAVCPGYIDTEALAGMAPERRAAALAQVPMRRFGRPEEVAAAVRFLASAEAAYITGAVLKIDGGIL